MPEIPPVTISQAFEVAFQHHKAGRLADAEAIYHQILAVRPNNPKVLHLLGVAAHQEGRNDLAIKWIRQAIVLNPDFPIAHCNLGEGYRATGRFDEAIAAYRRALQLKPDMQQAHNNMGNALAAQGHLDDAIAAFRRALQLKSDYPEALNNLGSALKDQGELDDSIAAYRRALLIKPDHAPAHSNLVYALHFHPGHDDKMIAEEHLRWNRQFSDSLKKFVRPHTNDRNPGRRLRVGYVSPDFRDHPVGRFMLPLLKRHDRRQFEILCYFGGGQPDWMTKLIRGLAGSWRNTLGVPDAGLAEMIRRDGVDILVSLTMHTAGNRLPVFARRPAPVQVAWLAYPGSTGLESIGYRLTDAHMAPPGQDSAWSSEEPVRLPDCWCCYDPAGESPEINALPASSAEGVTFGSLNNFAKVDDGVLALWARVLEAAQGSKLLMLCPEGRSRERVRAFFGARGIAAERVELVGYVSRWDYLRRYERIDVGLDSFPCNGMTTTCDALWMGAPVLTLPGKMPVSRAGLSILSTVGLAELAASSEEDYVRMAVELAGNLPRLAHLRATLRGRMLASPLMDAPRFARNVEAAYRSMWERWKG